MKVMTNAQALILMFASVSLVLAVTARSVRRLGLRGPEIWYLPQQREGVQLPRYLRPERPVETPDVMPAHPHFMFLDRRPARERLLPAHLAPDDERSQIGRGALIVWVAGGEALIGFAAASWIVPGPRSGGTVVGLAGIVLLMLAVKGWRQNRGLSCSQR